MSDGKIVFLEIGNDGAGWKHLRKKHAEHFAARGIPENQIIDAVMAAVINGRILGNQGRSRTVYEIELNGAIQYISVQVASNGYIIGANPTRKNLIRRFTQER